jgi:hypothetical protein
MRVTLIFIVWLAATVVVRAATTALQDPSSMAPLVRLPLSLLVTFLVPIIIASHVLVFARYAARSLEVAAEP